MNVLLGVSGSISAYKSAELVRLMVKSGWAVQVILTSDAHQFITPLTLSTLSRNPVHTSFVLSDKGEWVNHVQLGLWADVFVIAPCTAVTLGKLAHGIADSLLIATWMSARCPRLFAPAMDADMFLYGATQRNIRLLQQDGYVLIPPDEGELASGLVGVGRLPAPEEIMRHLNNHLP